MTELSSPDAGRPALPPNARIVVVSVAVGARDDGPADELGRRLVRLGWWVDRPDGLAVLPRSTLWVPVLDRCTGGWRARAVGVALDRLADRAADLIGDVPHAVVSTHPLISQLLGRLRMHGALEAPVIGYLTDPVVHPLCWHPGLDVVLSPHPRTTEQIALLAKGSDTTIVETAPALPPSDLATRDGGADTGPGRGRPTGVDPAWVVHQRAAAPRTGGRADDPPRTGASLGVDSPA